MNEMKSWIIGLLEMYLEPGSGTCLETSFAYLKLQAIVSAKPTYTNPNDLNFK